MDIAEIAKRLGDKTYKVGTPFEQEGRAKKKNWVHAFTINETGRPEIIEQVSAATLQVADSNRRIGVCYGGFLGIDISLTAGAEGILMLDKNPSQKFFWRAIFELIGETENLKNFREKFQDIQYGGKFYVRENRKQWSEDYKSFFRDEDLYRKLRGLIKTGMAAATDMDVLDTARYKELAGLLKEAGMEVGVIYLSNIPHFYIKNATKVDYYGAKINPDDPVTLAKNQLFISGPQTVIIKAEFNAKKFTYQLNATKACDAIKQIPIEGRA